MSLTYVSALERDERRHSGAASRVGLGDLLLMTTSLVAALAIVLAYVGRTRTLELSEGKGNPARIVDLTAVSDSEQLAPVLEPLFASATDRRFAARQLSLFLASRNHRQLPNVGALLRVDVPVETIEREHDLVTYTERLRVSRDNAAVAGREPPRALPLFTAADLASLKSSFVVRTRDTFRRTVFVYATVYILAFHLVTVFWRFRGVHGDRVLLSVAHLLTAIGFAVLLSRSDPLRDTLLFVRYTEGILTGLVLMAAVPLLNFSTTGMLELSYVPLIGALSLSLLLIVFGQGPGTSHAKINLGPLQPIEAIRLLLALFLAGYFARRWELLRQVRGDAIRDVRLPAWLNLPRADYVLPVLVCVSAALAFFFLQKDLGPAMFLCCVFLALYAVARARMGMAIAGLALLAAGFYVGYQLNISDTLTARIRMWQSPWDNAVRGGDQVAQAIWALATGGLFGTGLGLGDSRYLPAGHTDLILACVGEELGAVGLLIATAAYAVLAWRGFRIARAASSDSGFFLGLAITLFLVIPALVMGAGMLGLVPLTGVVTPFLSYGGSAMTANFVALGILAEISAKRSPGASLEPFRVPLQCLAAVLIAAAAGLVVALLNVQVLRADDYAVRPHLGLQGDGVRRFQYNPRVLDVVRDLPRGTVYDRQGLPLATEDATVALRSRDEYRQLGISVDAVCSNPTERCYPLGGRAFHLLGDSRTRANWSATNTSYIERDSEDWLRGFSDHAATIRTYNPAGQPALTVRRDYREVVPLLRHRHEATHAARQAWEARPKDLHLTVDARFQFRVASIIANYATKSPGGKAAAVVLDPDTGDLLAVVSYPWPGMIPFAPQADGTSNRPDPLLDRARYGLYPPGSTFKLVTAAAALRQNTELSHTTFTCTPLAGGRVGTRVPGWTRPIRDDVLDTHAHGTIDMHDGLVKSCNAYFAQFAVRLGPEAILDAAALLGISVAPSNSMQRLRETLPQAGYGQGDVLATPLRMARVAAAIASAGILREPQWDLARARPSSTDVLLPPDAAALLGTYLRDAVLLGTGRGLRNHPFRIAGKTGTAEVAGSPSHAWFVGFAPFGSATKRIAFSVILENAGYGGVSAAPVAGEIVSAAAAAGLVR